MWKRRIVPYRNRPRNRIGPGKNHTSLPKMNLVKSYLIYASFLLGTSFAVEPPASEIRWNAASVSAKKYLAAKDGKIFGLRPIENPSGYEFVFGRGEIPHNEILGFVRVSTDGTLLGIDRLDHTNGRFVRTPIKIAVEKKSRPLNPRGSKGGP